VWQNSPNFLLLTGGIKGRISWGCHRNQTWKDFSTEPLVFIVLVEERVTFPNSDIESQRFLIDISVLIIWFSEWFIPVMRFLSLKISVAHICKTMKNYVNNVGLEKSLNGVFSSTFVRAVSSKNEESWGCTLLQNI